VSNFIPESVRARLITAIKPNAFRRFLDHCDAYIDSVIQEARLRDRGEVLELEDYVHLRRENSAVRVCFGMIPYILGIDLPEEVFTDPNFEKVYFSAVDMVCWANVSIGSDRGIEAGLLTRFYSTPGLVFLQHGT
jgi:hypothetical protein